MSHDQSTTSPFRKVSIGTWADRKFMSLSKMAPSGQALFMMLLVGPQTTSMPGVQPVGRLAFAEMLDWEPEAFDEAFQEVFQQGLAKADWKTRFVFVPKAIQHNLPQSPNVVKSWASTWARIPDCELKVEAWHTIYKALQELGDSFAEAFISACPLALDLETTMASDMVKPTVKPSPKPSGKTTDNQKQEQKQKKEQDKDYTAAAASEPVFDFAAELERHGVAKAHIASWLRVRKTKKCVNTPEALAGFLREVEKSGISVDAVVLRCIERSWGGFEAEWVRPKEQGLPRPFVGKQSAIEAKNALVLQQLLGEEVHANC